MTTLQTRLSIDACKARLATFADVEARAWTMGGFAGSNDLLYKIGGNDLRLRKRIIKKQRSAAMASNGGRAGISDCAAYRKFVPLRQPGLAILCYFGSAPASIGRRCDCIDPT